MYHAAYALQSATIRYSASTCRNNGVRRALNVSFPVEGDVVRQAVSFAYHHKHRALSQHVGGAYLFRSAKIGAKASGECSS